MLRRLFTVLSALSVLLCAATVVLWVRSYRAADCVGWAYRDGAGGHVSVGIVSTMGAFSLGSERVYRSEDEPGFYWNSPSPALPLTYSPGWRTFGVESESDSYSAVGGFMAPHWFAAMLAGTPPAVSLFRRARRWRRRGSGRCPSCGYDLRATPGRCPECGRAAKPS